MVNIKKDLLPGDKIKRIEVYIDSPGYIKGNIYTFKEYYCASDLKTEELQCSGTITAFEFVERPSERIQLKELQVETTILNDYELLINITKQTHLYSEFGNGGSVFITSNGFKIESVSCPCAADTSNRLFVKGSDVYKSSTIFRADTQEDLEKCKFSIDKAVKEYNEFFSKEKGPELYKEEFIEAMKQTITEYLNDNHIFGIESCALCTLVMKKLGKGCRDFKIGINQDCKICPWIVLTGRTCSKIPKEEYHYRIKELLDWIKEYKKLD